VSGFRLRDRSRPWGTSLAPPLQEWRRTMDDILLLLRITANHNQTLVSAVRIAG